MEVSLNHNGADLKFDLCRPIDISIPLSADQSCPSAWYVEPMKIEPVRTEHFLGSVEEGGHVNFRNIFFNPHGNGTHTECLGHISKEWNTINQHLRTFFFVAQLISVELTQDKNNDYEISKTAIKKALGNNSPQAIVIRTLPNSPDKLQRQYSNTNPPYMNTDAMMLIHEKGIDHVLIDLPSVDKEFDNGMLAAHHIFWQYPENPQHQRTITELVYAPDSVSDGTYLLNLQIASFENDASPSKPVLYPLI